MEEASKLTGLSDFGDLEFLKYYKMIAQNEFYKSLTFSNLGNIVAQMEFRLVMIRKLKVIQYFKRFLLLKIYLSLLRFLYSVLDVLAQRIYIAFLHSNQLLERPVCGNWQILFQVLWKWPRWNLIVNCEKNLSRM